MKQKLFFVGVFLVGVAIGAWYLADFLHQHSLHTIPHTYASPAMLVMLIASAVLLQLAGHWLRAYKSKYLLDPIRKTRSGLLFRGLAVGYLFNTLLPLRLGEIIRAMYIGDAFAISKTAVFMSIVIERALDSFILGGTFILAGLCVHSFSTAAATIIKIGIGLIVLSMGLLAGLLIIKAENRWFLRGVYNVTHLFNNKIRDRMRFVAWSGIYSTRLMLGDLGALGLYAGLSVAMWVLYFASTACIALAFFPMLRGVRLWYVTQSVYAGVSAPAGPAYIGTFHLVVSRLLTDLGLHNAAAFSLFIWLAIIAPISLVGFVVLLWRRHDYDTNISKQEMLIHKLYREKDMSSELSHFLDAYLHGELINQILTQAELEDKFKLIRSFKGGSKAHTMLVWQDQELRVKKITLIQYADKLEAQAKWLTERAHLAHLPRIVAQEKTGRHYYFDLAFQEDYRPFFEFIHAHTLAVSARILGNVITFMNDDIYTPQTVKGNRRRVGNYIETKVIGKVNDTAAMSGKISRLVGHKTITINGKTYINLFPIIEKIKHHKRIMHDLASYKQSPIHGDLTIDNIIVSQKRDFLVLDPNNENEISTPVVDYAKLYQSLHSGYEFLIQLEKCESKGDTIRYEEAKSQKYAELFAALEAKLKDQLEPQSFRAILFHEAVHFCRMLTYRASINPATLPIFYATAVKLFNEFWEQYAESTPTRS